MNERAADWNPTKEQFLVYKVREVEMAKSNLTLVRGHAEMTLHSPETITMAKILNPGIGR